MGVLALCDSAVVGARGVERLPPAITTAQTLPLDQPTGTARVPVSAAGNLMPGVPAFDCPTHPPALRRSVWRQERVFHSTPRTTSSTMRARPRRRKATPAAALAPRPPDAWIRTLTSSWRRAAP
eukprot:365523-Chlamydomonas_euryale.AAC.8